MSTLEKYDPQVCVVIPTFNPDPEKLKESLDSIAKQTLNHNLLEIILVDDCSNENQSIKFLESLSKADEYAGIKYKQIQHSENRWLAEARTTGANATKCPFIVFLDDDDFLESDYIEKCLVLLHATPEAGWVYTNIRKFWQRNELKWARNFSVTRIFFKNEMAYSSMFRRDVWLSVGQRDIKINEQVRLFEDWDMYIRLIAKGNMGTPLSDTVFHYRKSTTGLAARSVREYIISIYVSYRMHFMKLLLLPFSFMKYRRFLRKGHSRLSILHPVHYINSIGKYLAKKFLHLTEFPALLDSRTALLALFSPQNFKAHVANDQSMMSLALMRSNFDSAPDMEFTKKRVFPHPGNTKTLLAGHIWWQMGGAENIFLEWIRIGKAAGADKIIDLVSFHDTSSSVLQTDFKGAVDIQYAISQFGETPYQRLKSIWNLIVLEQPRLIFISSNSYLYYLCPYIKREFPNIKIIDILHNEYDGLIDWFSISADFEKFIDCRIVTSEYWKKLLVDKYHVQAEKVEVTRNPVDIDLYDPSRIDRKALLKTFGLKSKKKTISFIGRLHDQKGLDVFLALAESMVGDVGYQFIIAGDGEHKSLVEDKVKSLSNLKYLGYFRTIENALAITDVLVCPSLYEGAPLIGLEAAAMNTALIATDVVGFREQIQEGRFGVLYPASMIVHQDALQIRDILLNEYNTLIELGKNGRAFAIKHHSLQVVRKSYSAILSKYFQS